MSSRIRIADHAAPLAFRRPHPSSSAPPPRPRPRPCKPVPRPSCPSRRARASRYCRTLPPRHVRRHEGPAQQAVTRDGPLPARSAETVASHGLVDRNSGTSSAARTPHTHSLETAGARYRAVNANGVIQEADHRARPTAMFHAPRNRVRPSKKCSRQQPTADPEVIRAWWVAQPGAWG